MARPSKTQAFTIFDDTGIPTPDSGYQPSFDEALDAREHALQKEGCIDGFVGQSGHELNAVGDGLDELLEGIGEAHDADDEQRRESAFTRTSISSLPESTYQTDNERSIPAYKPYTPPIIRPSFRRPESVRRMQMTSPPPFSSRSPRQSVLRHSRSRAGTPQSARSAHARGSPRPRRNISEETQPEEEEAKRYPLVLLHVTLLPSTLPWSSESMQDHLPHTVLDSLQLLRSKLTDTLLQRGLLIPHPRAEYELLEERLLEALELREERVTKCGHFHKPRDSTSSMSTADGGGSDSGIGSSIEALSDDGEVCTTCHHHVKGSRAGVGTVGGRKWTIKVYAANGLMRAPAWAAAWAEMERVDVEILPWIGEEVRRELDVRREGEEARELEQREEEEEEEERIKGVVEEQVRVAHEQVKRSEAVRERMQDAAGALPQSPRQQAAAAAQAPVPQHERPETTPASKSSAPTPDLPQIYRPHEIPLSVLLKNYILLLAQDRRNVVIFGLAVLLLLFSVHGAASTTMTSMEFPPMVAEICGPLYQAPVAAMPEMLSNASVEFEVVASMAAVEETEAAVLDDVVVDESGNEMAAMGATELNGIADEDGVDAGKRGVSEQSPDNSPEDEPPGHGWEDGTAADEQSQERSRPVGVEGESIVSM